MKTARSESGFSLIELMIVVALVAIMAGMAVPVTTNAFGFYRLSGDARAISSAMSLAKLRAASAFSRARLYVDTSANTFRIETWQKTGSTWTAETGTTPLSQNDSFGFTPVATAPPNSQAAIGQSSACLNDTGGVIANTACVLFNSRGIPIDTAGAPTGVNALYLTNGTFVYGVTLSATGLSKVWRTNATATPLWLQQ